MPELRFHPAVGQEIQQAVRWYETQARGLGEDFLAELETALTAIHAMPRAWTVLAPGFRRYLLQRFPYGVIYQDKGETLLVVAVVHQHRKPDVWRGRVS